MEMGKRIAYLRKKKGLSQAALAREALIAPSTLHGYEAGNRSAKGMSVDVALRLARALGVTIEYLIGAYDDEGELRPTGEVLVGT